MAKKGEVHWLPKGAFVMPELPSSLGVDPLLASVLHTVAFLNFSDDDTVDPAWAVEAMEYVSYYLQRMSDDQIATVQNQLNKVAKHAKKRKQPKEFIRFVETFLECAGVIDEEEDE